MRDAARGRGLRVHVSTPACDEIFVWTVWAYKIFTVALAVKVISKTLSNEKFLVMQPLAGKARPPPRLPFLHFDH